MRHFATSSSRATRALGARVAHTILRRGPGRHATVVALTGELGGGKTTFVQGFFRGLGLRTKALSPTFILMRRTALTRRQFSDVIHVDAYRLKNYEHPHLGIADALRNPRSIILIEWADRVPGIVPRGATRVSFSHGARENLRAITIQ